MTKTPPPLSKWLDACIPPGTSGLYFIGTFDRRITFFSQQVRALQLAHAMAELDIVAPNEAVAVVGGGASGVTVALALALTGKKVTLYDPAAEILQLQSASQRLLHPHIYEWPELGSLDTHAGLPLLDWSEHNGGAVCGQLKGEFAKACTKLLNLDFKKGHKLMRLDGLDGTWRLTLKHADDEIARRYKHVILALGFGDEKGCGDAIPFDYWKPSGIGTAATEPYAGASYLVSGNGDGGLTELLGLLVRDFEHVSFMHEFLSAAPGCELHAAANSIFANQPEGADLEASFKTFLHPVLEERGVIDGLRKRLRNDRKVTANSLGTMFVAGRAAPLNQCMVYAVLEAAKLQGNPVTRTTGEVTGVSTVQSRMAVTLASEPDDSIATTFDYVILRHGPDRSKRYEAVPAELASYKSHIESQCDAADSKCEAPALDAVTYDFFRTLWIEKLADHASIAALNQQAIQDRAAIVISLDPVAQVVVERGYQTVSEIAEKCESLASPILVQLAVDPSRVSDATAFVRLAKASGGRISLRASPVFLEAWRRIHMGIDESEVDLSRLHPRVLDASTLPAAIDGCLMRILENKIIDAVKSGGSAPIGKIAVDILVQIEIAWKDWRDVLNADVELRFDFLRWLANIAQDMPQPWDGNHGELQRMGNALLMMLATHHAERLVPAREDHGNLEFAAGSVALGSGCEVVGIESISVRNHPDQWGVDALILSGTDEVVVSDDPGSVIDAGFPGMGFKVARRVRPVVIQRSLYWRKRLSAGLAAWKAAVDKEFTELRERQDAALTEISE